jgi:hypothetical protein
MNLTIVVLTLQLILSYIIYNVDGQLNFNLKNSKGLPLRNQIIILKKDSLVWTSSTDKNGAVSFVDLPSGTNFKLQLIVDDGRPIKQVNGIHINEGRTTNLKLEIPYPCDFYYGQGLPLCKLDKNHTVIPIKYVTCYGDVPIPDKLTKNYLQSCETDMCKAFWYCIDCKTKL